MLAPLSEHREPPGAMGSVPRELSFFSLNGCSRGHSPRRLQAWPDLGIQLLLPLPLSLGQVVRETLQDLLVSVQCLLQVSPLGIGAELGQPDSWVGQQVISIGAFWRGGQKEWLLPPKLPWKDVSGWWSGNRREHLGPREC